MTDGARVLITGVAGALASMLARSLSDDGTVAAVIGVDARLPVRDLGRTRVHRVDPTSPDVGELLVRERIDTLVHLGIDLTPARAGGRASMKERNVIGSMHLLAAAQRAPRLRTVVLRSATAVYGSDAGNQSLLTEDVGIEARSGLARDLVEVEGYGRTLARRRDDIVLTVLRFANSVGGGVDSSFSRYLSLPVIPTVLGFDPRVQLCHTEDALAVLRRAARERHPGIFNVAGDGVLYLSQVVRITGRPTVRVPLPLVDGLAGLLRRTGRTDVPTDELRFLSFGRVADTSRLRGHFGYRPRYSTRAALEAFLGEADIRPVLDDDRWDAIERTATRWAREVDEALR